MTLVVEHLRICMVLITQVLVVVDILTVLEFQLDMVLVVL